MNRRKHTRFTADDEKFTIIQHFSQGKEETVPALLLNESFSGCSLVLTGKTELQQDDIVSITAGRIVVEKAHICWIREIEDSIFVVGVSFDE